MTKCYIYSKVSTEMVKIIISKVKSKERRC